VTIEFLIYFLIRDTGELAQQLKDMLIVTYKNYVTAERFLQLLFSAYFIPFPKNITGKERKEFIRQTGFVTKAKVGNFIKKWIQLRPQDFHPIPMQTQLQCFLVQAAQKDFKIPEYKQFFENHIKTLISKFLERQAEQQAISKGQNLLDTSTTVAPFNPPLLSLPKKVFPYS